MHKSESPESVATTRRAETIREQTGCSWERACKVAELERDVLRAYVECALWSSTDESTPEGGEPMDASYSREDIAPEALEQMHADVIDFLSPDDSDWGARFGQALEFWARELGAEQIGHDFWLTRNGHGAGFWDRFGGETEGARHGRVLTEAARIYGTSDLYVGDDGRIYVA